MSDRRIVRAGECLASLAARHGVSVEELRSANQELLQKRSNEHVLAPGDVVVVPGPASRRLACNAGGEHKFKAALPMVELVIELRDPQGNAISNTACVVHAFGRATEGRSDGSGVLRAKIPAFATMAEVHIAGEPAQAAAEEPPPDEDRSTYPEHARVPPPRWATSPSPSVLRVQVGHLEPADTVRGAQQRLGNLGFACRPTGRLDDVTREAIGRFQERQGLSRTGTLDDETRGALSRAHGDI